MTIGNSAGEMFDSTIQHLTNNPVDIEASNYTPLVPGQGPQPLEPLPPIGIPPKRNISPPLVPELPGSPPQPKPDKLSEGGSQPEKIEQGVGKGFFPLQPHQTQPFGWRPSDTNWPTMPPLDATVPGRKLGNAPTDDRYIPSIKQPPMGEAGPDEASLKINNMYHVPTGGITGKDTGTVYLDHNIPAEYHIPLWTHETIESQMMRQGKSYAEAHQAATQAEAQVVMASGKWKSWKDYTDAVDPYVARAAEQGNKIDLPPEPGHVSWEQAEGHHESEQKLEAADIKAVGTGGEGKQDTALYDVMHQIMSIPAIRNWMQNTPNPFKRPPEPEPPKRVQLAMEDTTGPKSDVRFSVPGAEIQGPGRGGVGGGYSKGGNVSQFVRGANINEPTEGGPSKSPHRPGRSITDLSDEERTKLFEEMEKSQVPYNEGVGKTPAHQRLIDAGVKAEDVNSLSEDHAKYIGAMADQEYARMEREAFRNMGPRFVVGKDFKPTEAQLEGQKMDKMMRDLEAMHSKHIGEMDATIERLHKEFPDLPPLPKFEGKDTSGRGVFLGVVASVLGAGGYVMKKIWDNSPDVRRQAREKLGLPPEEKK